MTLCSGLTHWMVGEVDMVGVIMEVNMMEVIIMETSIKEEAIIMGIIITEIIIIMGTIMRMVEEVAISILLVR